MAPFAWTLVSVALAALLALAWPARVRPGRRAFWRRGVLVALVPAALVAGQALLGGGVGALPWVAVFLAVSAAYLYALMRLDDGAQERGRAYSGVLLLSLGAATASLIVLSHALGFLVSVTTLLFLGASMPMRWLQLFTLPIVAVTVWLISATAARPPDLPEALIDGAGLLMTAVFGFMLRRSTRLGEQLSEANALLALHAEQAGELATLRERTRLARELHDTLGHALTTITVQLEAGERLLERNPRKARALFERARELSRSATAELRASLSELREGETVSLKGQLEGLALGAEPGGPRVDVHAEGVHLSPQQEHALARVAREALHNARRHADARHVRIELARDVDAVILRVRDDGRGFDPGAISPGHYGLGGMRERLGSLGGQLDIRSHPGEGAEITATLPLRAPQEVS